MANDKFSTGDVVYLRIGSPPMTVDHLNDMLDVHTLWFDADHHLHHGVFNQKCLFKESPELEHMRRQRANNMKARMGVGDVPEVIERN